MALMLSVAALAQTPKYVFYMIGDGMSIASVITTERYLAALNDSIGRVKTTMSEFPHFALANTFSATHGTTDSAAGGTALATGYKTKNGVVGMNTECTKPLTSIAAMAKASGKAVGVISTVSIDNATPAAFYAHVPKRGMYHTIGKQLPDSNFDFFGGGDFTATEPEDNDGIELHKYMADRGYKQYFGIEDYRANGGAKQSKVILSPAKKGDKVPTTLEFAINRQPGDLQLEDITQAAIDFLYSKNKGFFLAIEGGMIDHSCHNNDAASTIQEVLDFDQTIRLAYEFYKKHPKETLIVITADHETGGMSMGTGGYELRYKHLSAQKCSTPVLSKKVLAALNDKDNPTTWGKMKQLLSEETGLWTEAKVSKAQEIRIREAYYASIDGVSKKDENMYYANEQIASTAIKVLNEICGIGWTTSGHSGMCVPVFSIGVGAQNFVGVIDNTDIPRKIARIAGYKLQF